MGTEAMILTGLAMAFGLYMAWNIGANDVANAMGTSVGSGALTLKRAVILAAVMEFTGAFFIGPHVTETVRQGIIDNEMFKVDPDGARMLCFGMLASLLAAGAWLQLASYFGWPVSTTHSIVGSIVGFGCVYGGINTVDWFGGNGFNILTILSGSGGVASIVASWVVSPLLSGTIAYFVFRFVLKRVFYQPDPVRAARVWTPWIVFVVMVTMMLVLSFKGLKPFWKDNFGLKPLDFWPLTIGLSASVVSGIVGALVSMRLVRKVKADDPALARLQADLYTARAMSKALMHLRRVRSTAVGEARDQAQLALDEAEKLYKQVRDRTRGNTDSHIYHNVERIFIYLQIISAGFVALAHGSNDVANAIGPLSVVVETAREMSIPETTSVPMWVLGIGGVGIVIGLATWGWRVMQTVGKRITELTPSRGFCAEFAAALTILIASVYKLPISTTHTLVGAVLGVGLARGIGALNLNTIRDIIASWIITIPAGAGLAILFFYGLQMAFG
jgi:PiT family inorganic phosphate transporter/sodium-dependent phosphate transporter